MSRRQWGMRRAFLLALATILLPAALFADEWEIGLTAGKVVPFYHQTFEYDPGSIRPPFPGTTVSERGTFRLDASGALAVNGSLAWYPSPIVGLEVRLDTADVSVDTLGARYRLRVDLPAGLPPLTTDVDLGTGTVDLERLRPVSLGLKVRTPGRTRAFASAGVSYLPAVRFVAREGIGLGSPSLTGRGLSVDVARIGLRAEARPTERGDGRLGAHVGAGVQHPLSRRTLLTLEARYFYFQRQTLVWGRAQGEGALPAVQEDVVRRIEERLEPVRFDPQYFHVSAGLSLRF